MRETRDSGQRDICQALSTDRSTEWRHARVPGMLLKGKEASFLGSYNLSVMHFINLKVKYKREEANLSLCFLIRKKI